MITHEVIWDGTDRHGSRQLFVKPEPPVSARSVALEPWEGAKNRHSPLQREIWLFLFTRDMAMADIVEHFTKQGHCKSNVYGAIAALRTSGHITSRRKELRERANGGGPMWRDIYGPSEGNGDSK